MDLARWKLYDQYIRSFKNERMFAQLWFFADDSRFGRLTQAEKNRLFRYAMARTSAFSHTLYVIVLEWEEGWSSSSVNQSGHFIQTHNPWGRPLSVHSTGAGWAFSGQSWATFIASQPGNGAQPHAVNRQTILLQQRENIPHVAEEFGFLQRDNDARLRGNLWASFMGGAAGSGTGSDLKAFQRFLSQTRVPFQPMVPANGLVEGGGLTHFVRAEKNHHYAVYTRSGTFRLDVTGGKLSGQWFNPRDPDANLGSPFRVATGEQTFTPPSDTTSDWVLWITDGSNLNRGVTHPPPKAPHSQEVIWKRSGVRQNLGA
jgi:Putative collagen-binding domain of a collagenase